MIHLFIGTKAQYIKMIPIIIELRHRKIPYRLIDAGQHASLTSHLIEQFGVPQPDAYLRSSRESIDTFLGLLMWALRSLFKAVFQRGVIYRRLFDSQPGVCLIHGDTLTTLLSLIFAKRCGLRVVHVEAGLRSHNLVDPFPEEIIRLLSMRFSDLLYAPSEMAMGNLHRLGYTNKSININGNTGKDAVVYALKVLVKKKSPGKPYAVVTIHRAESIYDKKRMNVMVDLLRNISSKWPLLFVMHAPTIKQLKRFGLFSLLEDSDMEILPMQPYLSFVKLINDAMFVITDGGSIQEECAFLDVPCLILRKMTERADGIGKNATLSKFDPDIIASFFSELKNRKRGHQSRTDSPTVQLVDHLVIWERTEDPHNTRA